MSTTIALIGALDTKADDLAFVRDAVVARGAGVVLIDTGVLGGAGNVQPNISRDEVAQAADRDLDRLVAGGDRGNAVDAMALGASRVIRRLFDEGRIHGVIGMGGGAGTFVATTAMRALPIGFPKLMVSTVASGNTEPYVGTSDIVMMPAVADIAGLNRISRGVYSRAAAAIVGMARAAAADAPADDRLLVAATMFGVTTPCVERASRLLRDAGCDVVVFHATGVGGRTMEQLIADGLVDAVLDLTTTEWADELCGGILSAGPTRLDAAAASGIPQVVSVGALDMANFGAPDTIPERYAARRCHRHNALNTLMRTSVGESRELGRIVAGKLNAASGPTVLLFPLRGISALDAPGQSFDDGEAREALRQSLQSTLDLDRVEMREIDAHINDPEFAELAARTLLDLMSQSRGME
jgi:uncharacterized protein (UPF0261 family)